MDANANGGNTTPPNEPNVTLSGIIGATNLNTSAPPVPDLTNPAVEPNNPAPVNTPQGNQPPAVDPVPNGTPSTNQNPPAVPNTNQDDLPKTIETYEDIVKVLNSSSDHSLKGDIFNLFKATSSDDKGNLLNKDGKVVLNAERFKDFIENDNLPLNERGDAVNELGEVIKSKEQLDADLSVIVPIKTAVESNFGIKFKDDLNFTDNTEGIINLIQESVKQLNTGAVRNYLENNPELLGFAQHLALGGTADTYTSSNINYKDIDVKKLDDTSKIEYLKKSFALQGNANAQPLIDLIVKAGEEELNRQTAGALGYLDLRQEQDRKDKNEQLKQQQLQEEASTKAYWTNVQQIVNKGDLKSISIPLKDRQAFFDYISKPINDRGDSAEALDMDKDTTEFDLMVSYLRYKKGDLSQLVNNLATTKNVKSLSERIKKHNNTISGNGVPVTTSVNSNAKNPNITIESLLGNNNNNSQR